MMTKHKADRPRTKAVDGVDFIDGLLRRARSRSQINLGVRFGSFWLIAVLSVWLAAGLASTLGFALPLPVFWFAAVAAVLAFLLAVWAVTRRMPRMVDLARMADFRFGLHERISTLLEVESGEIPSPSSTDLRRRLARDAVASASAIDPASLVPVRIPRSAWLLPVLIFAIWIVQVDAFPLHGRSLAGNTEPPPANLTPAQVEAAAPDLSDIGESLRNLAGLESDPYLQAVAQGFDELAKAVSDEGMTADQFGAEVSRLMDHVERRLGSLPGGNEAGSSPSDSAANGREPPVDIVQPKLGGAPESTPDPAGGTNDAFDGAIRELDDLQASLVELIETRASRAIRSETLAQSYDAVPPPSASSENRAEGGMVQEGPAGGQPIGAAQQANQGEGDIAGAGAQPLSGDAFDDSPLGAEAGFEDVQLPEGKLSDGARIDRTFGPEASDAVVEILAPPPVANFHHFQETAFRHMVLDADTRQVVARYLAPTDPEASGLP